MTTKLKTSAPLPRKALPKGKTASLETQLTTDAFLRTATSYASLHSMSIVQYAELLKKIPAQMVDTLYEDMGVTREYLFKALGLSAATLGRKQRAGTPLALNEAERVLGLSCLIGQVESMVAESGNLDGFSAPKWFAAWVSAPNPVLGGRRADEFLAFGAGRTFLAGLLGQMQAGTYA